MFTRPPLLLTVAILGSIGVASFIAITPIGEDFWWSRLDPVGYGVHLLRTTRGFARQRTDTLDCPLPFPPTDAWRSIASHPHGDSLFAQIYARARPAGRLYALIGLYHLRAPALEPALAGAHRDTASVMVWDWKAWRGSTVPLANLISSDSLDGWAGSFANEGHNAKCAA